jgi:hypothetical protein
MAEIVFQWTSEGIESFTERRVMQAVIRAMKKAGGDAIRAVRAASKRSVRERVRLRAGYLASKSLPLAFPQGRSLEELAWSMGVSGKEVPLGEYPARQTRKGVSVEVQRGRRAVIESAFLAKGRASRPGVFLRPTAKRYPMGHRLGPSVADSMADGRIPRAALDRGAEVMESAFYRLLKLELDGLG